MRQRRYTKLSGRSFPPGSPAGSLAAITSAATFGATEAAIGWWMSRFPAEGSAMVQGGLALGLYGLRRGRRRAHSQLARHGRCAIRQGLEDARTKWFLSRSYSFRGTKPLGASRVLSSSGFCTTRPGAIVSAVRVYFKRAALLFSRGFAMKITHVYLPPHRAQGWLTSWCALRKSADSEMPPLAMQHARRCKSERLLIEGRMRGPPVHGTLQPTGLIIAPVHIPLTNVLPSILCDTQFLAAPRPSDSGR
ncbi:hypothetical protein SAMN05444164_3833 [Bradyrhizobium erythrophlei]|uniref:Uncharacterized protein n=1 Tax=Bradyrhizobium erythrophlei TaxID=1437360 RepID=A0A1H4Y8F5_9BRAD|nr:hypothetical protein SAMN05444164_3833 [Bradyrhizobium erythrophlei]